MEAITKEQICAQYLNQWVLIGNPVFDDAVPGSTQNRFASGIALFASKNRMEAALKSNQHRADFDEFTLIFTGEFPQGRRMLTGLFRRIPKA